MNDQVPPTYSKWNPNIYYIIQLLISVDHIFFLLTISIELSSKEYPPSRFSPFGLVETEKGYSTIS